MHTITISFPVQFMTPADTITISGNVPAQLITPAEAAAFIGAAFMAPSVETAADAPAETPDDVDIPCASDTGCGFQHPDRLTVSRSHYGTGDDEPAVWLTTLPAESNPDPDASDGPDVLVPAHTLLRAICDVMGREQFAEALQRAGLG